MARKVNIKLKQTLRKNKFGKGSSIKNSGNIKFKANIPVVINVTMKQKASNNNPNVRIHQGGSVKIAYANSSKTTTVNISQSNGNKPTVKKV
ncbi:MAG: hypothetical protein J6Z11_08945 [Candidatus Riflebacteria bacterium]|nr:hypothetical protein [Candidatus Riflebacteria bacterium]